MIAEQTLTRMTAGAAAAVIAMVTATSVMADWTPVDHPGTLMWLDASDASTLWADTGGSIPAASNQVARWDDKSGNGQHATQVTGDKQPVTGTRTINGLNVLDCDGNDWLEVANFPVPTSGDIAIFMVAHVNAVDNANDSLVSLNASNDFQFDAEAAWEFNGRINASGIGSALSLSGGPFSLRLFNCNFDKSGLGVFNAFVDGTKRTSDTTYSTKLDATQSLGLFANRGKAHFPEGAIGEVIITSDLTLATRQQIEGFLAHKWGLTDRLPAQHPYRYYVAGRPPAGTQIQGR